MRFPATQRLRRQADFSRLREQGSRFNCGPFVVNAAPPAPDTGTPLNFARFAVIASKKMVSNRAVHRNYAKRIFREIFRKNPSAFPPGWDVIIIARRGFEKLSFESLEASYREAARRIISRVARKNQAAGKA
ncbi:MAG: ribonuclease P protein component [Opitutales bacterium]|nr:ribonuclease P protein component [Opitutales bacterium]